MCGISGICNFIKNPSQDFVKVMTSAIQHRGPDDSGYFSSDFISLGHRRLSIIDIEKSLQPMTDEKNKNTIIFNGEIYNFKNLKEELIQLGHTFKTYGDTEVILKAYSSWGVDCLNKFEGMFAFAIWDFNKKQLFLARDKFGEKPIFYYQSKEHGLVFSSEIKSFIALNEIKKNLEFDLDSLNEYLSLNYLLEDKTFFKNIFQLKPASYILVNSKNFKEKIKVKKYWFLEKYFKNKTRDTFQESREKFSFLLKNSTKQRSFSDVNNGTFLSGGIDSSSISLQLKEIDNHKMLAHNISFKEKDFDEFDDAKKISKFLKIGLNDYRIPEEKKLVQDFPKIVEAMDQPMSDTSFIGMFYLSKYSCKDSKVVLSGDGADEIFCGYDTYIADFYRKFLPTIGKSQKNILKRLAKTIFKTNISKVSFDYKLIKFLNGLSFKKEHSHILWREIFSSTEKKSILNNVDPNLINYNFLNIIDENYKLVEDLHYLDQNMFIDIQTWLPNDILYKIDRSTMYHSQESRLPFLDSKLVEYVCSLPVSYKFSFFERKKLLRNILTEKLPKSLFKKKKSGFNIPVGLWLIYNKDFKDMAYDLLNTRFMNTIFKKTELENIWHQHQTKKEDQTYKIFNLICLSQWIINNKLEHKI